MQNTNLLYTANERANALKSGLNGMRFPRWVDVLTFVGVMLAIGVVLGGAVASGEPKALLFVNVALGVMYVTVGVFILLLLVDWVGLWGLLGLVPLALLGMFWIMGGSGQTFVNHLSQGMTDGTMQMLKVGFYGFAGLTGLGLLARLIEKVGIVGFLATIAIAIGISVWLLGGG